MAKWYGLVGFIYTVEERPGYWKKKVVERPYYGDVLRNTRRLQSPDKVNDDIVISNQISIVADSFANGNLYAMKYIEFMGAKWNISSADVQFPRIVLEIGGLYCEQNNTTN